MLSNHGFDLWADSYDESVRDADESNQYPFAGYAALMNAIYGAIMPSTPSKVLDIGMGTAVLASRLYEAGNYITGVDFSLEMIKIAKSKMPNASLLHWDFTLGIPPAIRSQAFDFIVSTYALHHLDDGAKTDIIFQMLDMLEPGGVIYIGDVCFPTPDDLRACKQACGDEWDEDESYFVIDQMQQKLGRSCSFAFHRFSFCAGIIELRNKP